MALNREVPRQTSLRGPQGLARQVAGLRFLPALSIFKFLRTAFLRGQPNGAVTLIEPGNTIKNTSLEIFNGKFRDECLNTCLVVRLAFGAGDVVRKTILLVTFSLAFLPSFYGPVAWAQSYQERARVSEQAGKLREALQHYLVALRDLSDEALDADQQLRERIISLVSRIEPKPGIPEDAERFAIRGLALLKKATSEEDFDRAISEFRKALKVAPWWADAYINHALVQEKAGDPSGAIRSLKFYLLASPNAKDAREVRAKMVELEVEAEELAPIKRLEGKWRYEGGTGIYGEENGSVLQLKSAGGKRITMVFVEPNKTIREWGVRHGDVVFYGSVQDHRVEGTFVRYSKCFGKREYAFTAAISSDGKTIAPHSKIPSFSPHNCNMSYPYQEGFTRISEESKEKPGTTASDITVS